VPNPMFNEQRMNHAGQVWPAPDAGSRVGTATRGEPVSDGPVSPWDRHPTAEAMSVNGTISATAVLFVLLLTTATFGWLSTDSTDVETEGLSIPMLAWAGLIVGFVAVIALYFKPEEIVEIPEHPWYLGVQFHPELKSKPFAPHPLFADFIRAALEQSRLV